MIEFNLDPVQIVQLFVLPVLLPVLVGLVSTRVTSSNLKAVLLLVLSTVSALITELITAVSNNTSYDLGTALFMAFVTIVSGIALHYGLLKPTGVTDKVLDTGRTAPNEHLDDDVDAG